ncbi:MAG: bifunctional phosphopantothenoylcysteine decarboxylase/phosphopantothenate--cysteine ligase CoaBC [Alphaproteobacteria bacterium]|nr:bifunctional phosphopantothenoylcysteine decarboxylase/phosphopantothenate--cysteine ligase CoaBC [Alphaproteobacteria bacterium]MCB9984567.1 bifunctional phosphopantothenoylcysteine decarboxylase/phosphopantothenate--cysteine ligase CoaBC [Micavibrio sp.]
MPSLVGKSVLLIISGGIAAYKSLELIRLLRKNGASVRCVLTKGGSEFVTPLSVAALSEHPVYTDLFSLKDESEMGHIRLSREADLIVVAPASANLLSKMANGIADDLASTTLLASNKPIMVAPAMNPEMWAKPATQRNIDTLRKDGVYIVDPAHGEMACGETGRGRMIEATEILQSIENFLEASSPLSCFSALVTSGPTYEPIDPVRFIGNRSSGKQGHAIATALARAGATVTLVTGPVSLPDPVGVQTIHVETAHDMRDACLNALPSDLAVCAAAVADWRVKAPSEHKMKKQAGSAPLALTFTENPDILAIISSHQNRPKLVIGFAAETENARAAAQEKLIRKGCDWIIANQVGKTENPVFGTDHNQVTLVTRSICDDWPPLSKQEVAARLVDAIINHIKNTGSDQNDNAATGHPNFSTAV